ncbi:MAG: hypothetical protein J6U34_06400 [Bacteroidales bacterium]|nr:hypothetical protein [Bacteroidales bacterium]
MHIRKIVVATIAVVLAVLTADAQKNHNPEYEALLRENPFRSGINTDGYEGGPYADTPAPKGYKPFYISHYGRHGSRSNWDEANYRALIISLERAKAAGILKEDGQTVLERARQCLAAHNGMDGRLTPPGAREHRGIAERMYKRFPDVFKKGSKNIRAISSTVPRVLISMTAFTDRLTELDPKFEISWDAGETYQKYIDPEVPSFSREMYEEIAKLDLDRTDSVAFLSRFFTDTKKASEIVGRFSRFESQVYAVARITASFELEDIFPLLPEESIYNNWARNNISLYLGQANSKAFGHIRMLPALLTVKDIVDKADEVLADTSKDALCADLRFGHDYPFIAMCSAMGLEGIGQNLATEEVNLKWFGPWMTPFAANLQMIFYKNKKGGDVLVKFLVNERETALMGVEPVSGPYYRWSDVRKKFTTLRY